MTVDAEKMCGITKLNITLKKKQHDFFHNFNNEKAEKNPIFFLIISSTGNSFLSQKITLTTNNNGISMKYDK